MPSAVACPPQQHVKQPCANRQACGKILAPNESRLVPMSSARTACPECSGSGPNVVDLADLLYSPRFDYFRCRMRLLVDGAQGRRRTGNPHCVGQPAKRDEGEQAAFYVHASQHVARVLAVPAVLVIFYPDAIRRTEISDGVKVLGHLGLGQSRESCPLRARRHSDGWP